VQGLESAAGAGAPAERIGTLVQQMQERGTVADAQPTDSGVRLNVYTCPFHGLGDARRAICEVERQTLGRIGGGPAKLKHSIARGHWCCEFEVAMVPQRARP
jgi:predicted ArsR family transcriptional regulator